MKLLISVLLPVLYLFYGLEVLPAEWYGDIDIVHEYVSDIRVGNWPWRYSLSAGPLYHYLITPVIAVLGSSYFSYKFASVIVGLCALLTTYGLAKEIMGSAWARLCLLLLGTSFWFLAWARTGNSQILIVALTSLIIWFAIRWIRYGASLDLWLGALVSGLGLFVYPQAWVLPGVFFVTIMFRRRTYPRDVIGLIVITSLVLWAWVGVFSSSKDVLTGGYVGSKFWPMFEVSPLKLAQSIVWNGIKTLGMIHVRGDDVFRVNIPGRPQLDPVSGVVFLFGLLQLLRLHAWKSIGAIIAVLLLILPSLSPVLPHAEVPNSGRTIGVLTLVYLVISYGLFTLHAFVIKRWNSRLASFVIGGLCVLIILLNGYRYFVEYPKTLPDRNMAWSRTVASYIDAIPDDTPVHLVSCCWGAWGHPNPKSIYYQLHNMTYRSSLLQISMPTCEDVVARQRAVYIGAPDDEWVFPLKHCATSASVEYHKTVDGQDAFISFSVQ